MYFNLRGMEANINIDYQKKDATALEKCHEPEKIARGKNAEWRKENISLVTNRWVIGWEKHIKPSLYSARKDEDERVSSSKKRRKTSSSSLLLSSPTLSFLIEEYIGRVVVTVTLCITSTSHHITLYHASHTFTFNVNQVSVIKWQTRFYEYIHPSIQAF